MVLKPLSVLMAIATVVLPLGGQNAGIYRAEPWNGMQIKYAIGGATVTSFTEGGPFCCWNADLKGRLDRSGTLSVKGSVGMGSGYHADAVVTVTVGGKTERWTARVVPNFPTMVWKDFEVSVPIPPGSTAGTVSIAMTGSYNAGSRGLSVVGSFTLGDAAPVPVPAEPPPPPPPTKPMPPKTPTTGEKTLNDLVADAVEDVIRQFEDRCFSKVMRLGDPAKYRKALTSEMTINPYGSLVTGKRANASHMIVGGPFPNVIHLPFDPRSKPPTASQKKSLWHEATHQIEVQHRDRDSGLSDMKGYRERNAAYLDRVVDALGKWARVEKLLKDGEYTLAQAAPSWRILDRTLRELEAGRGASEVDGISGQFWKPDLKRLEAWAGIRVRMDDLRKLYLSGECGKVFEDIAKLPTGGRLQETESEPES